MAVKYVKRYVSRINQSTYVKQALIFFFLGTLTCAYFVVCWNNFTEKIVSNLENQYSSTTPPRNPKNWKSQKLQKTFGKKNRIWPLKPVQFNVEGKSKETCPVVSPLLVGWSNISLVAFSPWKESEAKINSGLVGKGLKMGGKYRPIDCLPRSKVAIIVPYRKRKAHLKIFLRYMHPFLQRQQLEYIIVVVEQSGSSPFNRGMLMNIGFKETQLIGNFQCFIFHDVDLLPEDDRNLYSCPEVGRPRQMAFSIDIFEYTPTPAAHFGGVNAFSTTDFRRVNGFSNLFWGWGNEDDDLYRRVLYYNLTITRIFQDQPSLLGLTRYRMLDHRIADPNPDRLKLLFEGSSRIKSDGLTNLRYEILDLQFKPLYTHIFVNLNKWSQQNLEEKVSA